MSDRASELRAIADGRLMLHVRNGVTVSRSMLAMIADEIDALRAAPLAPAEVGRLVGELRDTYTEWNNPPSDGLPNGAGIMLQAATALEAQAAELAEVHQRYVDANEARIDAEAQLAERGKPFIAAAEEAYWLLAWTWQSHLTGPGKPFDMSIFAPGARDMMTKAEQDLFDALSEIEP